MNVNNLRHPRLFLNDEQMEASSLVRLPNPQVIVLQPRPTLLVLPSPAAVVGCEQSVEQQRLGPSSAAPGDEQIDHRPEPDEEHDSSQQPFHVRTIPRLDGLQSSCVAVIPRKLDDPT